MDMQNLLCKLAGKQEAIKANTNTWDLLRNSYNKGVLNVLDEVIDDLETITGLKAPVKQENQNVVHFKKGQHMAR
ncbi:MAG: hypothetical protein ABGU93_06945 [Acetobacterium sp.]|uniref:hypothetical protein n=1 Tax=Acetobacterium sp. TaxID=1872094 RepID=UPI0032425F57